MKAERYLKKIRREFPEIEAEIAAVIKVQKKHGRSLYSNNGRLQV